LPTARGTGAGKEAIAFVIDRAEAAGFGDVTLMAVNGADSYWSARGFRVVAARDGATYGAGSVLMRRVL
jgi:prepilin signal peptidase PulO-like enzyme (type II secretory pathway)